MRSVDMTPTRFFAMSFLALSLVACGGGDSAEEEAAAPAGSHDMSMMADAAEMPAIEMDEYVGQGNAVPGMTLSASFLDGPNGLLIRVEATGISPGWHGTHLHAVGDCSDVDNGFRASGGHYNPTGKLHGLLNPEGFELGDIPNIYAHADGTAKAELFAAGVRAADIIDEDGFAIVVHQNPDDHMTQPIGGAGPRLGCVAFNR